MSEIRNEGKALFTAVTPSSYHVVCIYYGTFIYDNMSVGSSHRPTVYPTGAVAVT